MNDMECPACGGTLDRGDYVAQDGSRWCETCYAEAREQVASNYALEEELALVDLHAAVLDRLEGREESRP